MNQTDVTNRLRFLLRRRAFTTTQLTAHFKITPQALSYHMKKLKQENLQYKMVFGVDKLSRCIVTKAYYLPNHD